MREIWAKDRGIYFGIGAKSTRGTPPKIGKDNVIRYVGDRHVVTVGPNGTGKSRRLLLPNLHDLTGWSIVVVDPKGDLAAMTHKHRAANGSRVVFLNPFDVQGLGSIGFNPIAALDPESDEFPDDAMGLAEAIIRVEGKDPHFGQSAQDLICALIMYVRLALPNATLADVRTLLGQGNKDLRETILAETFEYGGKTINGMIATAIIKNCPELEAKASRFGDAGPDNREISSVISVALTQTRWLDSRPVKADLAKDDFDFGILKEEPTTIYLILPARRLGTHSTWLRLVITSILQPLMKDTRKPKVPVLLMLDEFAQLGHLPVIEQNMALMRGYGVKLWAVFQDFAQAEAIYEDRWQSFLGNAGVLQAFAPQDTVTSDALSERTGQTTAVPLNAGAVGEDPRMGRSQIAVPLMLPQDFRNMDDGFSVILSHKVQGLVCAYSPYPTELEYMKEICELDPSN